jgi:hypothetical protein
MTKQEFKNIIKPLALLPSDQKNLLKSALINNFTNWKKNNKLCDAGNLGKIKKIILR